MPRSIRALSQPSVRPAQATAGNWRVDLPMPAAVAAADVALPPAPLDTTARATPGGQARINGRNLSLLEGGARIALPYFDADLVTRDPGQTLNLDNLTSVLVRVRSGEIQLSAQQANALLQSLAGPSGKLQSPSLSFLANNQLKLSAKVHVGPLPVPISLQASLGVDSPTALHLQPTSVSAFGLPVLWALRLFGVSPARFAPLPADDSVSIDRNETVHVDLARSAYLQGQIDSLQLDPGGLTLVMGAAPAAAQPAPSQSYAEITTRGDADVNGATLRNADLMTWAKNPQAPFDLNQIQQEGVLQLRSGALVISQARLQQQISDATRGSAFQIQGLQLQGTQATVTGHLSVLGLPLPVTAGFAIGAAQDGRLLLTPTSLSIAGISAGFALNMMLQQMAKIPGARIEGNSVAFDFGALAGLQMGPIKSVSGEPGQLVVST